MKKYLVLFMSALFLFALAPVASANFDVVDYDDTSTNEFDAPGGDDIKSVIINGAFEDMPNAANPTACGEYGTESLFAGWCSWAESKSGWESANLADADMAAGDWNRGMGWFISHNGATSGGYYAGAYQPLQAPAGQYFVSLSLSAWYLDDLATGPYNSVAWYAISDTANPAMVTEWRELYRDTHVCENSNEACAYVGRDEMVAVNDGDYLHIKVGHKFPEFLAKTVFVIDDIFMIPEGTHENTGQDHGFYNWVNATDAIKNGSATIENTNTRAVSDLETDADFKVHDNEIVYYSGPVTTYVTVEWNQHAPR